MTIFFFRIVTCNSSEDESTKYETMDEVQLTEKQQFRDLLYIEI